MPPAIVSEVYSAFPWISSILSLDQSMDSAEKKTIRIGRKFVLSHNQTLGAAMISIFCLQRPNWMFPIGGYSGLDWEGMRSIYWAQLKHHTVCSRHLSFILFHPLLYYKYYPTTLLHFTLYYVQNQMWYSYGYLDCGCPSLGFCLADQQMFQSLSHFQMALSLTSWRCIARERQWWKNRTCVTCDRSHKSAAKVNLLHNI